MYRHLSDEDLREAAKEALERPSDAAFWDERLYTTHAPVLAWADRGDDLIAESNYLRVLEDLTAHAANAEHFDAEAHEWEECCRQEGTAYPGNCERAEGYLIDASIGHWLVGSLRQLFVQVYEDDGETFTHVWREAVEIAYALRDYPIYDEDDFNEREWEEFERVLGEALDWAERQVFDDRYGEDADRTEWETEQLIASLRDRIDLDMLGWCRADDVDERELAVQLRDLLDEHYEEEARGYLNAQIAGQLALI